MKTNSLGLQIIKDFEGCGLKAYICPSGVWTIGYGHTASVKPDMVITQLDAERLLKQDLLRFEQGVTSLVKVPLTPNQFSALVSFAFNVGINALRTSTLLRLLNNKDYKGAAKEFLRWDKGNNGKPLPGLTKRRKAEQDLFNT